MNGITRAGDGYLPVTIAIIGPVVVVLDAQKDLFIVEHQRDRIIGENANNFRCLIGCDGKDSRSHQLFSNDLYSYLFPFSSVYDLQ